MEQDKKPNKPINYWLFSGLICAILSPFLLSNFVTFIGAEQPVHMTWIFFWMIFNLISFLFFWKCAYKKPGTKLLLLFLILYPIVFSNILLQLIGIDVKNTEITFGGLVLGLSFYSESFNDYPVSYLRQGPWTIKTLFSATAYVTLFSLFYYFSIQLYKKNKVFKKSMEPSIDTSAFIQSLQQAENLNILNQKYYDLIKKWPQFESLISKNYKLCKLQLEKK